MKDVQSLLCELSQKKSEFKLGPCDHAAPSTIMTPFPKKFLATCSRSGWRPNLSNEVAWKALDTSGSAGLMCCCEEHICFERTAIILKVSFCLSPEKCPFQMQFCRSEADPAQAQGLYEDRTEVLCNYTCAL